MDYYQLIQDQINERKEHLDKRMQEDADLLHLAKYVLKDSADKAVPGIINVTLNRPAVFGANVTSSIGNAKQQVIVESDNKKIDTHEIESFLDAAMDSANRRLWERGQPLLNPFADVQFCFRGRTARRILLRKEGDEVIPDITSWDGRYVFGIPGAKGWKAYASKRKKADIEAEYGAEVAAKVQGPEGFIYDVWDDSHNEIWVGNYQVRSQGHNYGFTPVVEQTVSLGYGPMLLDDNWQKYEGESIFFMIRDIVPEVNRLASILQTLNFDQIKAALQYQNPDGTPQDEPPDRPELGDVISVGKGSIQPISLGEARASFQMLYNIMEKAFQEGSYTDIDVGNVQQPFSAVALVTIGENKDTVYMPRLAAKELLNVATAEMLIKQARKLGGTIELGRPGHKKAFNTSKLEGEYSIDYKYFVKSPKIDIARMSVAQAAAAWYPRRYIYENVLQVEDPDGLMREWSRQEAGQLSPMVRMHRIITDLLKQAEENNDEEAATEAEIMALELGMSIEQIKMGVMQPKEPEKPPEGQPLLPLMGGGGREVPSSNKQAADLQRMPKEAPNGK